MPSFSLASISENYWDNPGPGSRVMILHGYFRSAASWRVRIVVNYKLLRCTKQFITFGAVSSVLRTTSC